jgi:CRISPR-associated protein Cas1
MIKDWLLAKSRAQKALHNKFKSSVTHEKILDKMQGLISQLEAEAGINLLWLRRLEALISRWHWAGVAIGLKSQIQIGPRNMRPAKDRFNALLNYLYGTLYGLVEGCQIAAGLDPHISIMHRMDYNTPSLVFDMIEPFRPWADAFAIDLFLEGRWQPDYAEESGDCVLLSPAGKKYILTEWFAWLEQKSPFPKKMVKRRDQVQQLCTALAADLLKKYNQQKK